MKFGEPTTREGRVTSKARLDYRHDCLQQDTFLTISVIDDFEDHVTNEFPLLERESPALHPALQGAVQHAHAPTESILLVSVQGRLRDVPPAVETSPSHGSALMSAHHTRTLAARRRPNYLGSLGGPTVTQEDPLRATIESS